MTRSLLVEQFNNFILTRSFLVCQCFIQFVFQYFHALVFQCFKFISICTKSYSRPWGPFMLSCLQLVKVYFCTGVSRALGTWALVSVFLKHGAGRALCDTYRYLQQFFVTLSFCHTVTLVTFLLWEKKNEEREFPANSEKGERVSECFQQTLRKRTPECFPGKHWEEGRRPLLSVFPANTDRKGERVSECSQQTLRRRTECVLSVFPANTERKAKTVAECFRGKHWEEGRRPLPSVFRANTEKDGWRNTQAF